jgi:hypothetical protein
VAKLFDKYWLKPAIVEQMKQRARLYLCNNESPVGEENDRYLKALAPEIVACWGNHGGINGRSEAVRRLLTDPYCFGVNKNGQPKHPLYLPATAKLERW